MNSPHFDEKGARSMQQNQPGRRFSDVPQQQPAYRFPQNQPAQGWQPQQTFPPASPEETPILSRKDQRELNKAHKKHHRRRFSLIWNLLAVIGLITVIIQVARYIVIPLLVYLNVLAGGAL